METVFAGGHRGAPEALWNDQEQRREIQEVLDRGDIDLFVMTVHHEYPTVAGCRRWVSYAIRRNPELTIAVALPWPVRPATMDELGDAEPILIDLSELFWLQAIYGVDLKAYGFDSGYQTNLIPIAQGVLAEQDPAYRNPALMEE